MTFLGWALVTVGSAITLLFVFAATRKKERHRTTRSMEVYEEEETLFGKGGIGLDELENETDLMSTDSCRRSRNVQILGDENSQCSDDDLKLYGLGRYKPLPYGPNRNDLGQRGDAVDVHRCSSATCPICSPRLVDPTFVKSIFPDT